MLLAALVFAGCSTGKNKPSMEEQRATRQHAQAARAFKTTTETNQNRITIPELDQLIYGYADRYFMVISSAADAIKTGNPNPAQRRIAHQIKLNGVQAINDIVSGNDPYAQVLDLVVSVTLQSILWIDEDQAGTIFGDRSPGLIKAMYTMRIEAWDLAARVLTQEQLEALDLMILEWRRAHPEVDQVAFVKFDNFASARSVGLLTDIKAGSGFLAPLSEASQVLKDWGRLTERVFWYSKRAPNVAAIQAEGAVNEILATPEVGSMLQDADRLEKIAESMPQTIDAQRRAFFAELDARQTLLTNSLTGVRQILAEVTAIGGTATMVASNTHQTLAALSDTLNIAERVGKTFHFDEPGGRRFDIMEYEATLSRLNEVVTNVHQFSLGADQIAQSEGWKKALRDMTDATDRRVDRAFSRLCLALGLAFLLAIAYRFISIRMTKAAGRTVREEP